MRPDVICADIPGPSSKRLSPGTDEEFQKAVEDARMLAEHCGPGYIGRVHANCGWHYEAMSPCRRMTVYPTKRYDAKTKTLKVVGYNAMLHEPGETGGNSTLYNYNHPNSMTPKLAIATAVNYARQVIAGLNAIVEGL